MVDFGELRSVLHASADEDTWLKLCRLLAQWPEDVLLQQAIPYVQSHTRHWDDVLRPVPNAWLRKAFKDIAVPAWSLCRVMDIRMFHPRIDEWERLMQPKYTSPMTHFYMGKSCLTLPMVPGLVHAALWPKLKVLLLDDNPSVGSSGLLSILEAPWPGLEELYLDNCQVYHEHVEAICQNETLASLRVLELAGARLTMLSDQHLDGATLPALRTLNLAWSRWQRRAVEALTCLSLPTLRHLDLTGVGWASPELRAITNAPWFDHLVSLNLNWNQLGPSGVEVLCSLKLSSLKSLNLQRNNLDAASLELLLTHPAFQNVRHIAVQWNPGLSDSTLRARLIEDARFT